MINHLEYMTNRLFEIACPRSYSISDICSRLENSDSVLGIQLQLLSEKYREISDWFISKHQFKFLKSWFEIVAKHHNFLIKKMSVPCGDLTCCSYDCNHLKPHRDIYIICYINYLLYVTVVQVHTMYVSNYIVCNTS